jgi:hypothetical protein
MAGTDREQPQNIEKSCKRNPELPKGVHVVRRKLADGSFNTHYYAWRGGPRLDPDTMVIGQVAKAEQAGRKRVADRVLSITQRRAKERGIEFDLDLQWFMKELHRLNSCCSVSGMPFDFTRSTGQWRVNPSAPSIDRISNTYGYTRTNSRLVLASVNIAINEWGYEHFLKVAEAVVAKRGSKRRKETAERRVSRALRTP